MNLYEVIFMTRPELSKSQLEGLVQTFSKVIENGKGSVSKVEYCGVKPCAYKIKKQKKVHYILMNIKAAGQEVSEMERRMRLNEDVLRYLTVHVETHETGPSSLSQMRSHRDRRSMDNEGEEGDFLGDEVELKKGEKK